MHIFLYNLLCDLVTFMCRCFCIPTELAEMRKLCRYSCIPTCRSWSRSKTCSNMWNSCMQEQNSRKITMQHPYIDWSTHKVTLLEPTWRGFKGAEDKADPLEKARFLVPKEYHEYLHIFSKEFFTSLSPHCPYNCEIPLVEGASLHHSPTSEKSGSFI